MSTWTPIAENLPPIEEPVWLYLTDVQQPILGVRTMDDGGWFWARTFGDVYWTERTAADCRPGWQTDTADIDDLKVSHWMPLPKPPTT